MQVTRIAILLLLITVMSGCKVDAVKVDIIPYELIHDNSSKVWLLKHQIVNGKETVPKNRMDRWVIVFYRDNSFVLSDLKDFGKFSAYQGRFSVSNNPKTLTLYWETGDIFKYNLTEVSHSSLKFNVTNGDQFIEYEYTTMDKRVKKNDVLKEEQYEESVFY